jgi:hypothetical protein
LCPKGRRSRNETAQPFEGQRVPRLPVAGLAGNALKEALDI